MSQGSDNWKDFTQPSPPRDSPPSDFFSLPPSGPSSCASMAARFNTPNHHSILDLELLLGAFENNTVDTPNQLSPDLHSLADSEDLLQQVAFFGEGNRVTTHNLSILNACNNANISSSNLRPHPNQLSRLFLKVNCNKFYIVTAGWQVGIFDDGDAARRTASKEAHSFREFSSWDNALLYYTQSYQEAAIEIRNPAPLPVTPTPPQCQRRNRVQLANPAKKSINTTRVKRSGNQNPQRPRVVIVSDDSEGSDALVYLEVNPQRLLSPQGLGTKSHPIVISPTSAVVDNPASTQPVDSLFPPAQVVKHCRVVVIDELKEEHGEISGSGQRKRVRHFHLAIHSTQGPDFPENLSDVGPEILATLDLD